MKKLILTVLVLVSFCLSCNDGDFDVPAFEFTEQLNSCGEYILYRMNQESNEVIILSLGTTSFGSVAGEKIIDVSTSNSVTYRIFDTGIDQNYFCQDIPPTEPKIIKELIAEGGNIVITTSEILSNGNLTGYSHDILITDLLFMDNNERIYFENFTFGTFVVNL